MALKLFKDLLNMTFKMFNKKASQDRQKCQFLKPTLRSPKKTMGHRQSPWIVIILISEQNCPILSCKQWSAQSVGTAVLIARLCLSQGRSIFLFVPYMTISQTFWTWKMLVLLCGVAKDEMLSCLTTQDQKLPPVPGIPSESATQRPPK